MERMAMRAARWCTGIGSLILGVFGILHGTRLGQVQQMMQAGGVKAPLDALVKASWLIFSVEMVMVAILAVVASRLERGGRIVLLCAVIMGANAALVFHYVGLFIGVYAVSLVTVLYATGGWLQSKART
jgi:hypothetical protein